MGYELRGIQTGAGTAGVPNANAGTQAENDKHFTEYVYNDVSGSLTIGMPVYLDVRDAAEWNNAYSGTALTSGLGATGGRVVLGATAAGTGANLVCVGVYQPNNINEAPNKFEVIRVLDRGRGLVQVTAKTAGTAVLVGDVLINDTTPGNNLLSGHNTRTAGNIVGYAVATSAAVASGNSIVAVPGSGATTQLINGFVCLS